VKERWFDHNCIGFSKIDGFFAKYLALRLEYGKVDDSSTTLASLLDEYKQGVEMTGVNLFSSFGNEWVMSYCSALEKQVNRLTSKINGLLDAKDPILGMFF